MFVVLPYTLRPGGGRCAGAPAELDARVIVGKTTASVPSACEMEGTESIVTLWYPQEPSYDFFIDFDEGFDVSVEQLEDEQLFLWESECDLPAGDVLDVDQIDFCTIDGREYSAVEARPSSVEPGFADYAPGPEEDDDAMPRVLFALNALRRPGRDMRGLIWGLLSVVASLALWPPQRVKLLAIFQGSRARRASCGRAFLRSLRCSCYRRARPCAHRCGYLRPRR